MSTGDGSNVAEKYLNKIVYWIEVTVAALLVILTVLALIGLAKGVYLSATESLALSPTQFTGVISLVLEVFILIELFRIALAYMMHRNVIPTVLEAALVAVARKFVVFEPKDAFLSYAAGHALLLVAVAVSWWLLTRPQAREMIEQSE